MNSDRVFHVTRLTYLESIERNGLLSPREAASHGVAPVLGSEGSNREVVQLFDLRGADVENVQNVAEGVLQLAESNLGDNASAFLAVVVLRDSISDDPLYGMATGNVRRWPYFEAWFRGVVPPTMIQRVVPFNQWLAGLR